MKKLLTLILVFSMTQAGTVLAAECTKNVQHLKAGEKAPCTGFLFSPKKEEELRKDNEELKLLRTETQLKDKKIKLISSEITDLEYILDKEKQKGKLWQEQAITSTEQLIKAESGRGTRDALFIGLGVLLTIGAGFAVGAAAK